jgi:hypothetical protein
MWLTIHSMLQHADASSIPSKPVTPQPRHGLSHANVHLMVQNNPSQSPIFNIPSQSQPLERLRLLLNLFILATGRGLVNPSAS